MKNEIIGRAEEQKELQEIFNSKKPEFVAVIGRRRVGKTFLIRNCFRTKKCIFFQVIGLQNGSLEEQLQNFTDALSETFYDKMPMERAADWKEAFQRLTSIIEKQNINDLCFRKSGLLFDEFEKLFKSLFVEADAYIELIRIIAKKRYGVSRSELEKKCKLSKKGGTMTERLKALEEAGFILSFLPLFHKTRGVYYKVIDEFSLFYLAWIEPEKNTLIKLEGKSNFWKLKHKTPAWNIWSGYAFEAICYKHFEQIRQTLDIPDGSRSGSWIVRPAKGVNESGAQIDLLFDRDDGAITLCEIKYYINPFIIDKEYAKNLLNKKEVFIKRTRTNKQIFITIVASNGIKNLYSDDIINGVITLVDLFH